MAEHGTTSSWNRVWGVSDRGSTCSNASPLPPTSPRCKRQRKQRNDYGKTWDCHLMQMACRRHNSPKRRIPHNHHPANTFNLPVDNQAYEGNGAYLSAVSLIILILLLIVIRSQRESKIKITIMITMRIAPYVDARCWRPSGSRGNAYSRMSAPYTLWVLWRSGQTAFPDRPAGTCCASSSQTSAICTRGRASARAWSA
jgi:hypothetical protein